MSANKYIEEKTKNWTPIRGEYVLVKYSSREGYEKRPVIFIAEWEGKFICKRDSIVTYDEIAPYDEEIRLRIMADELAESFHKTGLKFEYTLKEIS